MGQDDRLLVRAVHHVYLPPLRPQGIDRRPRRAARAQHHSRAASVVASHLQGFQKARRVGVVTDQPAPAVDDRVHRPDGPRRRCQLVEQPQHGFLVRQAQVGPQHVCLSQAGNGVWQLLGAHLAGLIQRVQSGHRKRGVVHGGRA